MAGPSIARDLIFKNFVVRPGARQVLVQGETAKLGARAFDVLMALIERRERVVNRSELFELVWPGQVVEDNNLTVQISALRKLLGPEVIVNVAGRGYRFTAPLQDAAQTPPAMGIGGTDAQNHGRQGSDPEALESALVPLLRAARAAPESAMAAAIHRRICVLPFANMSGDAEQEYFSDGITEDIITDLSKVSALWVAARNTAFAYKGKHVDVQQVARQLDVSHILEGSVRTSGGRVRITAQLIDAATGGHVWAERYDRELVDIFSLQDEISQAIVGALRLKLLPEEKKAIEHRGTANPEAYKLYLMARQYYVTGNVGAARSGEAIIRLCRRATEIDPNYARAWALIAGAQGSLRLMLAREGDGGLAAAERALALDPNLAEAHAAKARVLTLDARHDEARAEVEAALRLDPESYEVNFAAARWCYTMRRLPEAIEFFEKATRSTQTDFYAAGMLAGCYKSLGDSEGARRAAQHALVRCERAVALEPDNGSAMSFLVSALAVLGETERMKEWIERGTLLDPDNRNMRYNFACSLIANLRDYEAGLDLLAQVLSDSRADSVNWIKRDADLDAVREHPRYREMIAAAERRLALSP